ncbi:Signal peptidase I [Candidatus Erwinia haradaeae]|uniref:Signal peptidase I n=1 Tax=Candidatus Erwinia haradaeae TaxID=1922217 RepID=A0A451DC25_9GAMM|nr:signal peptidase I [Candidatus Erwinia haradaeae]VFP83963.1 Signal peptidase I [Candidatus Erwinia haradaeae]
MAHIFTLFLIIATCSSGAFWCINFLQRVRIKNVKNVGNYYKNIEKVNEHVPIGFVASVASLFPVLFVVLVVRSFIFEPFQIPSGSMMPTLLIGDFILVKKYAYGIKNPITQDTLMDTGHPRRGDIVVFKYPQDQSKDYIKRVIGLPGDLVTYNFCSKVLSVQTECLDKQNCKRFLEVTYSAISKNNTKSVVDATNNENSNSNVVQNVREPSLDDLHTVIRTETLGDSKHRILLITGEGCVIGNGKKKNTAQQTMTWLVPEKMYFVMGDNRDNSADSRYWGFVPEHNLVGQAIAVWMSLDKKEGQWPTGLRLSHIGSIH